MTIVKHELRQGKTACLIWTASITFLLMVCILIFPEMQGDMDTVGELFASMGSFTAAFGMDRLNIGTLIGFYVVECGNILGLGGAFFASLTGILVYNHLSKPAPSVGDDTMMEDFKKWNSRNDSDRQAMKAIVSALWCIIVVLYFVISFSTMAWYITWVIFLIGAAVESIIKAIFNLRK